VSSVVVIPAFDEEGSIGPVVRRALSFADRVIVADDGSKDGTVGCARTAGAEVLVLPHRGKGAAVRVALAHLRDEDFDGTTVLMDADGEHEPADIPRFLRAVDGGKDIVIGRRRVHRSHVRAFLNHLSSICTGILADVDAQCGFRALSPRVLGLPLTTDGYEIELEMVLASVAEGLDIGSLDITMRPSRPSRVRPGDMVRINAFFDRWIISNIHRLPVSPGERIVLSLGAAGGLTFSTILGRLML